jgi:large subunit ribosomal protein L16
MRVFTYLSITKKGLGVRMGKGKGNHSKWICPVRRGQIICEIAGVSSNLSNKALLSASSKLPFRTKILRLRY